ncbi:MAG: superoxide dismutase family protein [Candidatus Omnitrophica bacterium]|nr:superoxide dismutase family protein [Candidatus Omnitrophota bacterium]
MKGIIGIVAIMLGIAWPLASALADTGQATISGTQEGSTISGTAQLEDTEEGLKISIQINGAPPGLHGIHIHEFGGCADGGQAAGGHFNPDGAQHGFLPEQGLKAAHAGDLGNIQIDDKGQGRLDFTLPGLTLTGTKYSVEGRAVILHELKDDFGQPSGNAGGRIGCGSIVLMGS